MGRMMKNERNQRTASLKKMFATVRDNPLLCVALALYWSWVNLAFQGTLFFPSATLPPSVYLFPSWVGPVAVAAVAYFVLGMGFKRIDPIFRSKAYRAAIAAVMTLGALLCFIWLSVYDGALHEAGAMALYAAGSLGVGAGTACILIEWGRVFGYLGPQAVIPHGVIAMFAGALCVCLLSFFPPEVAQVFFIAIPIPLVVLFSRASKKIPRKRLFNHGLETELHTPYKFLITALLHGLALGVLLGSLVREGGEQQVVLLNALSFSAAAVLLLLTTVFVRMDFNHLIYQVGFGIMALGAMLIAIIPGSAAIGEAVQFIGFCYVHLIMWGLCSYLTKTFELPAPWVVAWPTCALMLGQLIGGTVSAVLVQTQGSAFWTQTLATIMVFVLLMSALIMFSRRNLTTGWGIARPTAASAINPDKTLEAAIRILAVESNLTPRESEIFARLARGRNRKYISIELTVTEETVKSHINNIYRKLGVHSQQELLQNVHAQALSVTDEETHAAFE